MANPLILEFIGKDNVSKITHGITGALGGLGKVALGVAAGGMIAATGAAIGLGAGLVSAVGAAMDAQAVQSQLNAVLQSTGGIAGVTADKANELASSLQAVTRFEDDAILSGENMLLTFTNIGKDVFPDATVAMLDMSEALGQDMKMSAIQLGKALNDPIQGVTALRRVGVQLTDEQEDLIKSFMEVGDIASAQKIILGELQREFGGSAYEAGQTFAGQLERLRNKFGDVMETIGTAFLPMLQELAGMLLEGLNSPAFQAMLDSLVGFITESVIPIIQNLVAAALGFIHDFIIPFAQRIGMLISTIMPGAVDMFGSFGSMIGNVAASIGGFVKDAIPAILLFVRNTVVPLIGEAIGVFSQFGTMLWEFVQTTLLPVIGQAISLFMEWGQIIWTQVIPAILGFVTTTLVPLAQQVAAFVVEHWPQFLAGIQGIIGFFTEKAIPAVMNFVNTAIIPMINSIREWINELVTRAKPIWDEFISKLNEVGKPALDMISQAGRDIAEALRITGIETGTAGGEFDAIKIILVAFKAVLDAVIIGIQFAAIVFRAVAGAIRAIRSAIDSVISGFNDMIEKAQEVANSLPDWLVPGSPTPLELGLRGIGRAMQGVNAQMGGGFAAPAMGGGGGSMGPIIINLTYAPAVSLADRYEAESVLAPLIAGSIRRQLEARG